jgi:hypothetical protein
VKELPNVKIDDQLEDLIDGESLIRWPFARWNEPKKNPPPW